VGDGHDWHLFDEVQGLEVAQIEGVWNVREVGQTQTVELTAEEWDQVRQPGPDPDIMRRLR
jgi:hypothetical protein